MVRYVIKERMKLIIVYVRFRYTNDFGDVQPNDCIEKRVMKELIGR